jgi:hypothetical protein
VLRAIGDFSSLDDEDYQGIRVLRCSQNAGRGLLKYRTNRTGIVRSKGWLKEPFGADRHGHLFLCGVGIPFRSDDGMQGPPYAGMNVVQDKWQANVL